MTIPIIKTLVSADIENATTTEQKVWKKFCGFIEKDLNSRGGIGGLPVKLAYRPSVQPLNRTARAKQQIREMRETDCVINVNMTTPKTGTLTLIDKIFSFFYFLVGVNTTFLISAVFIPQLHESVSLVSQFGLPIAALSVSLWLYRKVKKNRKKVMDDVHI